MRTSWAWACTLICCVAPTRAQTSASAQRKATDTSYVTCGDKAATSRTIASDIYVTADGKRKAYAEVTAKVVSRQGSAERSSSICVNNSRLFVSSAGENFELVFLQEATDTEGGNSLQIVDWSGDNRRLLFELAQWQYESPGITRSPLIYQADIGVFQQPDLARAFRKQFGIECSLDVRVAGFSSEGKVVLDTEPMSPEAEEVLALPSCARKKAQWLLNVAGESISQASETTKIVRNAKVEARPEK